MNDGGRLQRMVAALGPHVVACQPAQFVVHQGRQPFECLRVTGSPLGQ